MRVRLLGPVDVAVDDAVRPVPGLRRKAVLAALALHPDTTVSTDRLVAVVWGDAAPATAATTLQSHMSRLRNILGRDAIQAKAHGYRLNLGPDASDAQTAERLIQQGTRSADRLERVRLLRQAIDLWRGGPLADLIDLPWFAGHARRLDDLLLQARHALTEARLELGEHVEVIGDLQTRSRQHPFHEQTHAQLILALYRAGRQADALTVYERLRRTLNDELGVEPSRPLRDLQRAVLRQDPHLAAGPPEQRSGAPEPWAGGVVPAQLPPGPAGFTGRAAELTRLDRLTAEQDGGAGAVGATYVLCGPAGIGKTSLAMHWARRVAAEFPDGQLYVNLRGFDPGGQTLSAAEAVRGFLYAFGVPAHHVPPQLDAQVGLYRSILAGKRVLIVLDNARDADQVRPLLPGAAYCTTVITSRNDLAPLVATEAAAALRLAVLTTAEARDLLTLRLGPADPDALDGIVACCAGLPLALAIVAARAATHPDLPLSALADELRRTNRLDALTAGDAATDIRTVFSWSLQALSPDAATMFRLLGLHPGPDVTPPAAASLAGLPGRRARHLLTELTRAHLLTQHAPGRYTMHDLLRAYATEQSHTHDTPAARHATAHRLLDHYLHTAHTAALLLHPTRDPIVLTPAKPGVTPETLTDQDAALTWFTTERAVLLAMLERAATGFDTHTWQLAWAFTTYLLRQGHWPEHITTQLTALAATHRLGHRPAQADILHSLARSYLRLGVVDDASTHFQRALDVCADLGDPAGQAHNQMGLAEVAEQQGRPADALRHNEKALKLFRTVGDRVGEANALNGIGWCYLLLDNYPQALLACTQGLELLVELHDQDGQAATWDSLGCIHRGLAQYEQAIACHHRSISLCRDIGDRYWEADALKSLGDTLHVAGDAGGAREAWQQALTILDELDHHKAAQLRAELPDTATPPPMS